MELSTVTPGHIRGLAGGLGERCLEAPMIGFRHQVEGGQLQLLVGGAAATLERAQPVLDAVAGGVHHVGGPGDAAVLKLVVNGLLAAQLAVVGELLGVVRRAGLDEGAAAELLATLPVASPAVARSLPRIVARDTAPAFPIALAAKDLGYLLGEARRRPRARAGRGRPARARGGRPRRRGRRRARPAPRLTASPTHPRKEHHAEHLDREDRGTFALVTDPDGNALYLHTAG